MKVGLALLCVFAESAKPNPSVFQNASGHWLRTPPWGLDPWGDKDGDGIPNVLDLENPWADEDGDGVPNALDLEDTDRDGIPGW
jgi:hypothetical protein